MNIRQLVYGVASFLPFKVVMSSPATGGSNSAEYCYSVWLRHLVLATKFGMSKFPGTVAELGPGDSIGVGLAALISGADRYFAFDAEAHAIASRNLVVFDELVELFQRRSPIPGPELFPELKPTLSDHSFPLEPLSEERLAAALAPRRLAILRAQLARKELAGESAAITYKAPWNIASGPDVGTADFIFSQAVMEHVDDIAGAYRATFAWLRSGGFASHQIDFRSHALFADWDGHWACPDWLWTLMRGRRNYLLNRFPYSVHRHCIEASGFRIVSEKRVLTPAASSRLAKKFQGMDGEDRQTSGCYVLLRKSGTDVNIPT